MDKPTFQACKGADQVIFSLKENRGQSKTEFRTVQIYMCGGNSPPFAGTGDPVKEVITTCAHTIGGKIQQMYDDQQIGIHNQSVVEPPTERCQSVR